MISVFEGLNKKLEKSKEYFNAGMNDFKKGGHVYQGEPLAKKEFNDSINKIDASIKTSKKLISVYEAEIKKLKEEKANL